MKIVTWPLSGTEKIKPKKRRHCQCPNCYCMRKVDSFSHSLFRVNALRGLASPAYITIAAHDPILWSLHLSNELYMMAEIENEFKNEYYRLAVQCRQLSVDLLNLCWNISELETILNGNDHMKVGDQFTWGSSCTGKCSG